MSSLAGAAMIRAGRRVFDHTPHGSFFHATGGHRRKYGHEERLKLIPYECAVGLMMTIVVHFNLVYLLSLKEREYENCHCA